MYIKELYIRITKVKVDFGIGTEAELLCNTSKNWKLTFFMKKSMLYFYDFFFILFRSVALSINSPGKLILCETERNKILKNHTYGLQSFSNDLIFNENILMYIIELYIIKISLILFSVSASSRF